MKRISDKTQMAAMILITFSLNACAHKEEKREYINSATNSTNAIQPVAETVPSYSEADDLRKSTKFNTLSQNVKFETGSTQISKSTRRALDEIAAEMQRASSSFEKVRISGHSDSRTPANDNRNLALARANRVKGYLVSKGVPSVKLEALAESAKPSKNRSVDFIIVE